jgi:type VI secretion system protein ImpH
MAAKKWEQDASVAERLFNEFYKFSFYQAVMLLEQLGAGKKSIGEALTPADEPLRFVVKPGFAFPPSDIKSLTPGDAESPTEVEVTFLGLIGPAGLLPNWYNELAIERLYLKDSAMVAFFNIFHHRLLSLFYLAWKKNHFSVTYRQDARDRFSCYLKSLMGIGTEGLAGRIGFPEESLLFSGGLLSRQVPSAIALQAAVAYYSGQPVELRQFIERVIQLPPEERTRLGQANAEVGVTALCGSQVWENQTKFRIILGPMGLSSFFQFLPTGKMFKPVFSLVRFMVGIEYEFELRVILRREEVPLCRMGGSPGSESPRLGWSTWLTTPNVPHAKDPYVTFQESEIQ